MTLSAIKLNTRYWLAGVESARLVAADRKTSSGCVIVTELELDAPDYCATPAQLHETEADAWRAVAKNARAAWRYALARLKMLKAKEAR